MPSTNFRSMIKHLIYSSDFFFSKQVQKDLEGSVTSFRAIEHGQNCIRVSQRHLRDPCSRTKHSPQKSHSRFRNGRSFSSMQSRWSRLGPHELNLQEYCTRSLVSRWPPRSLTSNSTFQRPSHQALHNASDRSTKRTQMVGAAVCPTARMYWFEIRAVSSKASELPLTHFKMSAELSYR